MESTPWMTKTGAILVSVGTAIGGASQIVPEPAAQPWMVFVGVLLSGLGAALMGQGIRRNLPTNR